MKQIVVQLAAVTVAIAGCGRNPPVEGKWIITSAVLAGQKVPPSAFNGSTLDLAAGQYAFLGDTGTYAVRRDSTPMIIDVQGVKGPNAGRRIPAIFRFDGDTLTICYDLAGKARPRRFDAPAGTQLFLVRYIRAPKTS